MKRTYFAAAWPKMLLIVITGLTFSGVTTLAFTNWDDPINIYENPLYQPVTLHNTSLFWIERYNNTYRPLTHTVRAGLVLLSSWVPQATDSSLAGAAPPAPVPSIFHGANLVLHIVNVLLVYALLQRLLGMGGFAAEKLEMAAFWGAALFALHPLQVEAVAWATGLNDLLVATFMLLSLHLYLLSAHASSQPQNSRLKVSAYGGGLLCLLLALLCKPSAVSLPLLAFVCDVFLLRQPWRHVVLSLLPWAAVALGFVIVSQGEAPYRSLYSPLWFRPIIAADALSFYGWKLLYPVQLAPHYGRTPDWLAAQGVLWTWALVPGLAAWLCWGYRRWLWLTASFLLTVMALLPVLGLVPFRFQVFSTVADRYMYLPLLGISLGVAWLALRAREQLSPSALKGLPWRASLWLLLLGVQSGLQVFHWTDGMTLWRHTLTVNPNSPIAHDSLGVLLAGAGDLGQAEALHRRAVQLDPLNTAAHNNLGTVLARQGRAAEAVDHFSQVTRLDPNYVPAWRNLATALTSLERHAEARPVYEHLVKVQPQADYFYSLGFTYGELNQPKEAIAFLERAISMDAAGAPASWFEQLAALHVAMGNGSAAAPVLETAASRWEGSIARRRDRADMLQRGGQPQAAAQQYELAAQSENSLERVLLRLCRLHLELARTDRAQQTLQRLQRLSPDAAEVRRLRQEIEAVQSRKTKKNLPGATAR